MDAIAFITFTLAELLKCLTYVQNLTFTLLLPACSYEEEASSSGKNKTHLKQCLGGGA